MICPLLKPYVVFDGIDVHSDVVCAFIINGYKNWEEGTYETLPVLKTDIACLIEDKHVLKTKIACLIEDKPFKDGEIPF